MSTNSSNTINFVFQYLGNTGLIQLGYFLRQQLLVNRCQKNCKKIEHIMQNERIYTTSPYIIERNVIYAIQQATTL